MKKKGPQAINLKDQMGEMYESKHLEPDLTASNSFKITGDFVTASRRREQQTETSFYPVQCKRQGQIVGRSPGSKHNNIPCFFDRCSYRYLWSFS